MRLAVPLLLCCALPAAAFTSVPAGENPHDDITADAAEAAGWPGGLRALQEAVRAPDLEDFRTEPHVDHPTRIDATDSFNPWHHCDRVPPTDNGTAFQQTAAYVTRQREQADAAAAQKEVARAVELLGRALHAAQDCFSHSNYPDLGDDARSAFVQALLNNGTAPEETVLTAFAPGAENPTSPDDPYPHDTYAKDSPDKNEESQESVDGRTKYEIARMGAVQVSAPIMAAFLGPLDDQQRDAVAALRSDEVGRSSPGASWLVATLLIAGLASARSRRK